jgi:hypothetical protein
LAFSFAGATRLEAMLLGDSARRTGCGNSRRTAIRFGETRDTNPSGGPNLANAIQGDFSPGSLRETQDGLTDARTTALDEESQHEYGQHTEDDPG